jgi:hypothetical protein
VHDTGYSSIAKAIPTGRHAATDALMLLLLLSQLTPASFPSTCIVTMHAASLAAIVQRRIR